MLTLQLVRPTFLLMLLPLMALGDGKVFPPVAVREAVTIPDQRALIHWSNGTERLVIETRFTGAGSNFAWVVPLPAKPVIEKASSGLFPTLDYLFRPELVHKITRWYLAVLAALGLAYLLYAIKPGREPGWKSFVAFVLVCASCFAASFLLGSVVSVMLGAGLLMVRARLGPVYTLLMLVLIGVLASGLLLPSLARSSAGGNPTELRSVEVLERNKVGAYETITIASQDPLALDLWLRENGFAVSSNAAPVIADYVQRGWVFVAAKLARDQVGKQTSTAHPLSFTFPAANPVYPLRLTGVDGGPLSVDLYVFGPARAAATNFVVTSCTRPAFPQAPSNWIRRKPEKLEIYPSPLREWVQDAAVATKLSAKLTPHQLGQDIALSWKPFHEMRVREFSHSGARHYAANWASLILVFLLLVSSLGLLDRRLWWLWRARWLSFAAAALAGIILYSAVEKVPVRFLRNHFLGAERQLTGLVGSFFEDSSTPKEFRDEMKLLAERHSPAYENRLLGGFIREEDSPDNYVIRETEDVIELIRYDAAGAPHVIQAKPKSPEQ